MTRSLRELLDNPPGDGHRVAVAAEALDREAIALVPRDIAERHRVVGLAFDQRRLLLGMEDPRDARAIDDVAFQTGRRVVPIALDGDVAGLIKGAYAQPVRPLDEVLDLEALVDDVAEDLDEEQTNDDEGKQVVDPERAAEHAPIVKLANLVLVDAIRLGASDIHIERHADKGRVKLRRHGRWHVTMTPPAKLCRPLLERLKRMADIDERGPAVGLIHLKVGKGKEQRYRLVTRPGVFGDVVSLRLIYPVPLASLFDDDERARLERWTEAGGLIVAAATAGQGATTTAHAVSRWMAHRGRAVVSFSPLPELLADGVSHGWPGRDGRMIAAALAQGADFIVIDDDAVAIDDVLAALRGGALVWLVTRAVSAERARAELAPSLAPYLRGVLHQTLVHEACAACGGAAESCESCGGVGATSTAARFSFLDDDDAP